VYKNIRTYLLTYTKNKPLPQKGAVK